MFLVLRVLCELEQKCLHLVKVGIEKLFQRFHRLLLEGGRPVGECLDDLAQQDEVAACELGELGVLRDKVSRVRCRQRGCKQPQDEKAADELCGRVEVCRFGGGERHAADCPHAARELGEQLRARHGVEEALRVGDEQVLVPIQGLLGDDVLCIPERRAWCE